MGMGMGKHKGKHTQWEINGQWENTMANTMGKQSQWQTLRVDGDRKGQRVASCGMQERRHKARLQMIWAVREALLPPVARTF